MNDDSAAQPFMQPQVVASRKGLAEAIRNACGEDGQRVLDDIQIDIYDAHYKLADGLLAAGVFRDEADVLCSCFVISDVNDNCPQHGRAAPE